MVFTVYTYFRNFFPRAEETPFLVSVLAVSLLPRPPHRAHVTLVIPWFKPTTSSPCRRAQSPHSRLSVPPSHSMLCPAASHALSLALSPTGAFLQSAPVTFPPACAYLSLWEPREPRQHTVWLSPGASAAHSVALFLSMSNTTGAG